MSVQGTLRLQSVDGDSLRFDAEIAHQRIAFDSGPGAVAANPVQHLLAALAACEAMDVISVLRKKRQDVTAYEVRMEGERAEEHPRRYTSITLVHRITGRGLQAAAAEDAVRLSVDKYCSVHHSLRPDLPITNRIELIEG